MARTAITYTELTANTAVADVAGTRVDYAALGRDPAWRG